MANPWPWGHVGPQVTSHLQCSTHGIAPSNSTKDGRIVAGVLCPLHTCQQQHLGSHSNPTGGPCPGVRQQHLLRWLLRPLFYTTYGLLQSADIELSRFILIMPGGDGHSLRMCKAGVWSSVKEITTEQCVAPKTQEKLLKRCAVLCLCCKIQNRSLNMTRK